MAARLVVEWTRTSLRLALAEGDRSRARVRWIRSQSIGVAGETGEAVHALLGKRPPAIHEVIGVIPREQVITRLVKFPTTRQQELVQMVELYAKAQLPYPREQAVYDFHMISQQEGFTTVAIIAAQREVVERQLVLLREARLSNILLTVSSWGVLGWYRQALYRPGAGQAKPDAPGKEPSLVVNVDDSRTDLVLIAEGRILSSRSVGQGAQDWQVLTTETGELLAQEIERSRAAIRKELPGTEVRSCLLTGLGPLPQWTQQISTRLGISVEAIEGRQPFTEWTTPLTTPISPVVVGGLACSDVRALLDLGPPELRVQVRHRRQVQELVMVAGLLLAVLALGSGLLAVEVSRQRTLSANLDRALTEIEPTAKQVREKTRAAELVGSVLEDRRRLAATLSGAFHATPPSIILEVVSFERTKREVSLRGSASSNQDVLEYTKRLEQLAGVSGVQLKYWTRRSTPTGERTDFELILQQHMS